MTGKLLTGKNMAEFLETRHIIPVVIILSKEIHIDCESAILQILVNCANSSKF